MAALAQQGSPNGGAFSLNHHHNSIVIGGASHAYAQKDKSKLYFFVLLPPFSTLVVNDVTRL
jgi:hypothetical protein